MNVILTSNKNNVKGLTIFAESAKKNDHFELKCI